MASKVGSPHWTLGMDPFTKPPKHYIAVAELSAVWEAQGTKCRRQR